MAILAGIDEAGFGPIVGPLVVSVSVFRTPDELADACLWRVLAGGITRKSLRRSPALPVADSKRMHVRTDGVVHLERGLLGMLGRTCPAESGGQDLSAPAPQPRSLRELLRRCAPAALEQMRGYPWYAEADLQLPLAADPIDISLRGNAAAAAMAKSGVSLARMRAEPVLAGRYNRIVGATRNKSVALFGFTGRLIAYVFGTYGGDGPLTIVVDRQGGRVRYLGVLQRIFEGAGIRILEEGPQCSAYRVGIGGRECEIRFRVKAESHCLPVALASMLSKYLRELFMTLLNRWWRARIEGLRPTAGYHTDGRRFLRDIEHVVAAEDIDRALLVRSR